MACSENHPVFDLLMDIYKVQYALHAHVPFRLKLGGRRGGGRYSLVVSGGRREYDNVKLRLVYSARGDGAEKKAHVSVLFNPYTSKVKAKEIRECTEGSLDDVYALRDELISESTKAMHSRATESLLNPASHASRMILNRHFYRFDRGILVDAIEAANDALKRHVDIYAKHIARLDDPRPLLLHIYLSGLDMGQLAQELGKHGVKASERDILKHAVDLVTEGKIPGIHILSRALYHAMLGEERGRKVADAVAKVMSKKDIDDAVTTAMSTIARHTEKFWNMEARGLREVLDILDKYTGKRPGEVRWPLARRLMRYMMRRLRGIEHMSWADLYDEASRYISRVREKYGEDVVEEMLNGIINIYGLGRKADAAIAAIEDTMREAKRQAGEKTRAVAT